MKEGDPVSEPTTTGIGAALGWKAVGGAAGVAAGGLTLGTIVVMLMRKPRTDPEWAVAIISSVASSLGFASLIVLHWSLQKWAESLFGLMTLGSLYFACSLPGWMLVRWLFNWMNRREDKDLAEVAAEVKGLLP